MFVHIFLLVHVIRLVVHIYMGEAIIWFGKISKACIASKEKKAPVKKNI